MTHPFEVSIEISEPYKFEKSSLKEIQQNPWVRNQWPLVYLIQNPATKVAYVGESTNASNRIKNHLATPKKTTAFNQIAIIGSDTFNKSATLDIESKLIQYIAAEGTYTLQNGNIGLTNHNYYQQHFYNDVFVQIWSLLREKNIVRKSLTEVANTELFKYSPYKSLNEDQHDSVFEILESLTVRKSNHIFVSGSAGTGKTILATYLMKLLTTPLQDNEDEEYTEVQQQEINYIKSFQAQYPNAKIGLVIAMTSLRETLQDVFRKTPGLKANMVINPADTFKTAEKYDLLIIDEAHRLRKYKNISWMGAFKKNNQKLGLDDTGTELDWVLANSKNQIFFYDAAQSVKPSDVDGKNFLSVMQLNSTLKLKLQSQMRVQGGLNYIEFVHDLLNVKRENLKPFNDKGYELILFEKLPDLYSALQIKEQQYGLARLVAGYAWPWRSKEEKTAIDIKIDGMEFQWNQTDKDWINSATAFQEIGCIHTVQGYDLNYTGVIFGSEITYNAVTDTIEVRKENYFDQNGKKGIKEIADLKSYIINIYKTIMYRGIKGTFIYVCDQALKNYIVQYIGLNKTEGH
jgi:DUF2075 family protein/Cdc6-like AAA superfamily ATPase